MTIQGQIVDQECRAKSDLVHPHAPPSSEVLEDALVGTPESAASAGAGYGCSCPRTPCRSTGTGAVWSPCARPDASECLLAKCCCRLALLALLL